jgi:hypothetical protein
MAVRTHEDFPLLKQLGIFGVYGVSHGNPQWDPTFLDRHCDPEDASKRLVRVINPSPAAVEFHESIRKDRYWAHFKRICTIYKNDWGNCPELKFIDHEMYERGHTELLKEWAEYEALSLIPDDL